MPTNVNSASSATHPVINQKTTPSTQSGRLPIPSTQSGRLPMSGVRGAIKADPDAIDLNPPSSRQTNKTRPPAPPAPSAEQRVHVQFRNKKDDSVSTLTLVFMILVAIVTSVLAALFLPKYL
jgi:hypothetical protein